jgi:type IV pilus assembly protein PilM
VFWNRKKSSTGAIGIDFRDDEIRLAQVRMQGQELRIVGAALELIQPTRHFSEDQSGADDVHTSHMSTQALTPRLQTAITHGGFTGRECVLSVPPSRLFVQSVRLPRMSANELQQAVQWEAAQRLSCSHQDLLVDYIATGASVTGPNNREEIILVAVRHSDVMPWVQATIDAGLKPIAVDANFGGLSRVLSQKARRNADLSQVRMVVEVGADQTTVVILRGDRIAFCKQLDIGGGQFDQAVADHLQLDGAAASELRRGCGKSMAEGVVEPATQRAIFEAVRPHFSELVKEVVLCLRYYGVTFRGMPPQRLIMTGLDGLDTKLMEMMSSACKIQVELDDEQGTLAALLEPIRVHLNREPGPASRWAVSCGLSLRKLWSRHRASDDARSGRRAA